MSERREAVVLTEDPVIEVLAENTLNSAGVAAMADWVGETFPDCLPDGFGEMTPTQKAKSLFPHDGIDEGPDGHKRPISDAELLAELAGRKCYNSFGKKAGRKLNSEYIANTQQGAVPHRSILYHCHITFFFGGISRRVSHEIIRHYVGASRDEEGSPSQESTRYVEHAGRYIAHPLILGNENEVKLFHEACKTNYERYLDYISRQSSEHYASTGEPPRGMVRKRIYESASPLLMHSCETSFIWTSNPIALAKMIQERDHDAADLEIRRFAKKLKKICRKHWPNLFCQPWMVE